MSRNEYRTHIRDFRDLQDFGIDALTSEGCSYNMRILCDLSARGKRLMEDFTGMEVTGAPMNSGFDVQGFPMPAVGSCFIAKGALRELAMFIFWHVEAARYVIENKVTGELQGLREQDFVGGEIEKQYVKKAMAYYESDPEQYTIHPNPVIPGQPRKPTGANVHNFSEVVKTLKNLNFKPKKS